MEVQQRMNHLLTCSICLERFRDPKTLTCEHSFCRRCLEKAVKKSKGIMVCPTCRFHQFQVTEVNHIRDLPTSLLLKQTMDLFMEETDGDRDSNEESKNDDGGDDDDDEIEKKNEEEQLVDIKGLKIDENDDDTASCNPLNTNDVTNKNIDESSENESEDEDDLKKEKEVHEVSDLESEHDETNDRSVYVLKTKKKKSMFSKLSKHMFRKQFVLEDISMLKQQHKAENMEYVVCSHCGRKGHNVTKCTDDYQKTRKKLLCGFCNSTSHDLGHCPKAVIAARHEKRKQYVRTAAVVGTGYLATARPGSQTLMQHHTPGMVGYGYGVTATNQKTRSRSKTPAPKPSSSRVKKARGRGTGRGGKGIVLLL